MRCRNRPECRAGSYPGAIQPGIPGAPYRNPVQRRSGGRGCVFRRHAEGRGKNLSAISHRRGHLLRLRQAVHQQSAGYGGTHAQRVRAPLFRGARHAVITVLSDNGREFCGRPDRHPYELFLQLEGIEHRTTRVRRPQSNGFVERLHRTLLDEHFRIQGRRNWYESLGEMQTDLDVYLHHYNHERAHQGRNMNGRTPYQAFLDGLPGGQPEEDSKGQQAA